jgi:hypothetical protein
VRSNPLTHSDPKGLCPYGFICPDEDKPGWVGNAGYCYGAFCIGITVNQGGYVYLNGGLGTPGPSFSVVQSGNMEKYCEGFTFQGGAGYAEGANPGTSAVGIQWPPGASFTYGIPWIDVTPYGWLLYWEGPLELWPTDPDNENNIFNDPSLFQQ